MTEPLSTVCDHCGAKLKLKNPDLEGKKIKCPKCGEAFVATAAANSKPTPAKLAKKKTASDDEDLSFLDVDPDDYGPPPDEDDDADGDDGPKARRTRSARGGKKKPKKKSKGGGDSAKVVKIVAIILAVVAVLGGGGFAMMSLTGGSGASDLDWLPSDIQGYVKVQVDDIWGANAFQSVKNGPGGQKFVEEMTKNVGVGPQDVDQMIVGLPANGQASGGVMLVRSKKPIDAAALQSADPAAKQMSHLGSSYLKMADNSAVFLPDPKTLLRGPETAIKTLIERGKKNPSEAKFAFARNNRDHLVMAMVEPSASTNNPMAGSPFSFASGQNSESVLVRANASSDIRLTLQGAFKTSDAAKVNADKAKADLEKGKAELTKAKTQLQSMPPNPFVKPEQLLKLMNGAEQVMNSIQVSQSGSHLNIQLSVSGQLINDFTELASSTPGGPPLGFPMPFGSR